MFFRGLSYSFIEEIIMGYKQYCKEPEKIENYDKAKADNFKGWHCHHRLETHNLDGERRLVDITRRELIALNMYYNRPASELIFLTSKEHNAFKKGKHLSEEHRNKIREAMKGNKYALGYKHSEEAKNKISEANKGKKLSEETRRKMSEAKKCARWYNNGKINVRVKECPDGFIPGRLKWA